MRLLGLLDIASVPPPASSTVPLTCRSVKLPVEFSADRAVGLLVIVP